MNDVLFYVICVCGILFGLYLIIISCIKAHGIEMLDVRYKDTYDSIMELLKEEKNE